MPKHKSSVRTTLEERLIELWREGCSIGQIAHQLTTPEHPLTRSAVGGLISRLRNRGVELDRRLRWRQRPKPKPLPRPPRQKPKPAPDNSEGVGLMDLIETNCRTVLDRKGKDGLQLYCGRQVVAINRNMRLSYCPNCARRYYPKII